MNKTAKADIAAGHQWKYCNVTKKKAKNFNKQEKKENNLLNSSIEAKWD
jgi:hypothetical protein